MSNNKCIVFIQYIILIKIKIYTYISHYNYTIYIQNKLNVNQQHI